MCAAVQNTHLWHVGVCFFLLMCTVLYILRKKERVEDRCKYTCNRWTQNEPVTDAAEERRTVAVDTVLFMSLIVLSSGPASTLLYFLLFPFFLPHNTQCYLYSVWMTGLQGCTASMFFFLKLSELQCFFIILLMYSLLNTHRTNCLLCWQLKISDKINARIGLYNEINCVPSEKMHLIFFSNQACWRNRFIFLLEITAPSKCLLSQHPAV